MQTLYIDGGCLDAAIKDLRNAIGGVELEFDYLSLVNKFNAERAFYYDALPGSRDNLNEAKFQEVRQKKEAFFQSIAKQNKLHVRTGVTRWERMGSANKEKQKQKAVDVLLAVDVVSDALKGNIDRAIVLTSDLDFYPVFEALLQSRVHTTLIYRPGHVASELIEVADGAIPLRFSTLLDCCEPNFAAKYRPIVLNESGSLLQQEREKAQTVVFRGHEIAVWQQEDKHFVCFYANSRVVSLSKVLAIEYWTQGRTEALTFSDGSIYP